MSFTLTPLFRRLTRHMKWRLPDLMQNTPMKYKSLLFIALAFVASAALTVAQAQGKPIRLIVPYAAGGPLDITARVLAESVKSSLGPVIIDNKPGAGGNIGAGLVVDDDRPQAALDAFG